MNSTPRQILRTLILRYGLDLCSDVKRCQGLLRDLCGSHQREVNILVGALRERVPLDLLAGHKSMSYGLLKARLSKRLEEQLALTEEAARWGVESWAMALGIITEAELEETGKSSAKAAQPPAAQGGKQEDDKNQPQQPSPAPSPRQQPTQYPGQQTGRGSSSATRPQARTPFPTSAPSGTVQSPGTGSNIGHQPAPAGRAPTVRPSGTQGTTTTTPLPEPPINYDPQRRRGFKLRGCMMGCLLLIILSSLIFLVVPYVVSVLREEQQRINESPRLPPR